MKILKPSNDFTPILLDCACGAKLEVEFADIKRYFCRGEGCYPDTDYPYIICPCCDQKLSFKADLIPEWMYSRIPLPESNTHWR